MALLVTDICWAIYISKVGDKNPLQSALWAVFLFLSGAVAVIGYTTNPWLLIPAGAGAFCGTYLGVWFGNRKELRERRRQAWIEAKAHLVRTEIRSPDGVDAFAYMANSMKRPERNWNWPRVDMPAPSLLAATQDNNEQLRRTHGQAT